MGLLVDLLGVAGTGAVGFFVHCSDDSMNHRLQRPFVHTYGVQRQVTTIVRRH